MTNALAQESSPYLRQHADNPVDWMPWSPLALACAREQNKPILLSIGYSACHWCHVMAHESFANPATAAVMNRYFINIKVDREERPDIDRIYQTAHHLIARRPGGWPLTMFLAPDQLPFFGGTYFPDQPKYGMIAFPELLQKIADIYHHEPDKIQQQGAAVHQALIDIELRENQNTRGIDAGALKLFDTQLLKAFDAKYGGFGQAPKFPQPAILLQALRRGASKSADDPLTNAIRFSLQQIARGGIQDHVGGGFYRYSVDEQWMIPHFEKMLYDNGQLLQVFSEAYRLTADDDFDDAAQGIVEWLEAEMRSASGAYCAALDADSEGQEGQYYLWTPQEVEALIGAGAYARFAFQFGLDRGANFEGRWHLHGYHNRAQVIDRFRLDPAEYAAGLEHSRQQLLTARQQRVRPGLDNKILTSWNALVIRGLMSAARVFLRNDYYSFAHRCLQAIRQECWQDGCLLALSANSGKTLSAYLDDYAHLLQAVLDCLQFEWHADDYAFAELLAQQLRNQFEDPTYGGFYFTARDHEKLIQRPKSWQDEAMPSGAAVAALALHRLGLLNGNREYTATAERALRAVADNVNQTPLYAAGYVALLDEIEQPPLQIIVRGEARSLHSWRDAILPRLNIGQTAFFIPDDALDLPDALANKSGTGTAAWVCEGFSCRAPLDDLTQVTALLARESHQRS